VYFALSGLLFCVVLVTRGDALRACPWLSYSAPLALSFDFYSAPLALFRAKLYSRWRSLKRSSYRRYFHFVWSKAPIGIDSFAHRKVLIATIAWVG